MTQHVTAGGALTDEVIRQQLQKAISRAAVQDHLIQYLSANEPDLPLVHVPNGDTEFDEAAAFLADAGFTPVMNDSDGAGYGHPGGIIMTTGGNAPQLGSQKANH